MSVSARWEDIPVSVIKGYATLLFGVSRVVSSVNEYILPSHATPISFTYSKYNSGPKIEP